MDVVVGQQADLGAPPIQVGETYDVARRVVMSEEFVNEEPATGSGGFRSLRMKRSLVPKPVKGGQSRSLVGFREHEVHARFNAPAVLSSVPSEVGTGKLALAQEECC